MSEIPEMEDHREFVTYDTETATAKCSKCGISIIFDLEGNDPPVKNGGDEWANHSFERGVEITSIGVQQHDDRLDIFKEFLNG